MSGYDPDAARAERRGGQEDQRTRAIIRQREGRVRASIAEGERAMASGQRMVTLDDPAWQARPEGWSELDWRMARLEQALAQDEAAHALVAAAARALLTALRQA
jgi:hypothetical protein